MESVLIPIKGGTKGTTLYKPSRTHFRVVYPSSGACIAKIRLSMFDIDVLTIITVKFAQS